MLLIRLVIEESGNREVGLIIFTVVALVISVATLLGVWYSGLDLIRIML